MHVERSQSTTVISLGKWILSYLDCSRVRRWRLFFLFVFLQIVGDCDTNQSLETEKMDMYWVWAFRHNLILPQVPELCFTKRLRNEAESLWGVGSKLLLGPCLPSCSLCRSGWLYCLWCSLFLVLKKKSSWIFIRF